MNVYKVLIRSPDGALTGYQAYAERRKFRKDLPWRYKVSLNLYENKSWIPDETMLFWSRFDWDQAIVQAVTSKTGCDAEDVIIVQIVI